MNPQAKCVSLETAKKLKEAGFPQETERWWEPEHNNQLSDGSLDYCQAKIVSDHYKNGTSPNGQFLAAPDAQEIGEVLPAHVSGRTNEDTEPDYWLDTYKYDDEVEWAATYTRYGKDAGVPSERIAHFEDKNEAESRAACWLWLKENNLL